VIATIGKTFTFDASHQLPNHDGKCARLHGHTYSVTIELRGPISTEDGASDEGMVADYGELKRIWKSYIEPALDHQHLNDTIGGECWPTTAENIAAWLLRRLQQLRPPDVEWTVAAVVVRETPTSFARVEA
jgi:6-pyruvoyltetrahydropterin/6-carboxytetrahydropterin synthase